MREAGPSVDPITVEVLRNAFTAVCNEMALVVKKTAYSTVVNEGNDFGGGLYDAEGRLVAQGEFDLPAFVGLTHLTVPAVIAGVGRERMRPGDVYMINDPYIASTHCNDIHFVKPVFRGERLVAFTSSTAHWSDVGGVVAGSLNCNARSQFEEGMRIPAVAICKEGEVDGELVSLLVTNMRQSWERMGDLNAQLAAVRAGDARVQALVERHGLPAFLGAMVEVQDHAERMVRAALAALPDGEYWGEDRVDQDVATGEPVTVRLRLTIAGDEAVFDLRESDGAAQTGINCTIAATTSAVFIGMASILPPMPMNAGVMRAIAIKARRGSIVWAQPPAAISGLAITSMDCVIGAVLMALGQAHPERAVGLPSACVNSTFAGHDARAEFQTSFINYVWAFGGTGGTQTRDGGNNLASPYSASSTNIPCEMQERRYPVLYWRHMLLPDSGGAGASRGGCALEQLIQPSTPGSLSNITNRARFGPPGVFGGEAGRTSRLVGNPGTEEERAIGTFIVNVPVGPGELLSFWSCGGGGYGDPLEREAERVLEDVRDGYVSIAGARSQYGLVVRELDGRRLAYEVDEGASARLREELRASRGRGVAGDG